MPRTKTRFYTDKLLSLLEDGALEWEDVCRECLQNMSEDDVKDMCDTTGYLDYYNEEDLAQDD